MNDIAPFSFRSRTLNTSGSNALPQLIRCPSRSYTSPNRLTARPELSTGGVSSVSGSSALKLSIRRSISPISKPVASSSKSRSTSESSLNCSASSRSSQTEFSVSLLSAIMNARICD